MGVPSLNDLAVDGTLNTTNQPTNQPINPFYLIQIDTMRQIYREGKHATVLRAQEGRTKLVFTDSLPKKRGQPMTCGLSTMRGMAYFPEEHFRRSSLRTTACH